MSDGKRFSKPGPFGDTYLYDGDGNLIGRGFPDASGTVRFTGTDGEYIGKSESGAFGGTKLFDADGKFIASGVDGIAQREGDIKTFWGGASEEKGSSDDDEDGDFDEYYGGDFEDSSDDDEGGDSDEYYGGDFGDGDD